MDMNDLNVHCPYCGQQIEFSPTAGMSSFYCPTCGAQIWLKPPAFPQPSPYSASNISLKPSELPEFKSVLDIANLPPEQQFHRLAEAIRKAVLPLCMCHQALEDKSNEEPRRDVLGTALMQTIRNIMAIAVGLRALAKEVPPPQASPPSAVQTPTPSAKSKEQLKQALAKVMEEGMLPSKQKQSPSPLVEFLDDLATEISGAIVSLSAHQQLLANKWQDPEFRASLDRELVESARRVTAAVNELRTWTKCLDWLPLSHPLVQGYVEQISAAHFAAQFQAAVKPWFPKSKSAHEAASRIPVEAKPVADLALNELYLEYVRLNAEREHGPLATSSLARLQDVISRIQYEEWSYEI